MEHYYHGTHIGDISVLRARSCLHKSDKKVVYLTDCIPYALFYIWDPKETGCHSKHVTGWVGNGIAYYEEQFPDQLAAFYQNVSGYLYTIQGSLQAVDGRPNMFYSEDDTPVSDVIWIPNVYDELLKYEEMGKFVIRRYTDQTKARQEELIDLIAADIKNNNFYKHDLEKQVFMQKYFRLAWEKIWGCRDNNRV